MPDLNANSVNPDQTPRSVVSFVETDHEIFSTIIPSLLLIQEGQLYLNVHVLSYENKNKVLRIDRQLTNCG